MSITKYSPEEIAEMSMIEVAYQLMEQNDKNPINYYDLLKKVAELKGLSQEEIEERIAQFYTDLNIDGRFICLGENMWGLKHWYPYDQIDDDISQSTPKKKKKKKKAIDDFDLDDEFDEDLDDLDDEDFDDEEEIEEDDDLDEDDEEFEVDEEIIDDDELALEDFDDDLIDDDELGVDEELDDELDEDDDDLA